MASKLARECASVSDSATKRSFAARSRQCLKSSMSSAAMTGVPRANPTWNNAPWSRAGPVVNGGLPRWNFKMVGNSRKTGSERLLFRVLVLAHPFAVKLCDQPLDALDFRVVGRRFQSLLVFGNLLVDLHAGLTHSSWRPFRCKARSEELFPKRLSKGPAGHSKGQPDKERGQCQRVYERRAPGILEETGNQKSKGRAGSSQRKHHQWLNGRCWTSCIGSASVRRYRADAGLGGMGFLLSLP